MPAKFVFPKGTGRDQYLDYFNVLVFHMTWKVPSYVPNYVHEAQIYLETKKFHWAAVHKMITRLESEGLEAMVSKMRRVHEGAIHTLPAKDFSGLLKNLDYFIEMSENTKTSAHQRMLNILAVLEGVDGLMAQYENSGVRALVKQASVLEALIMRRLRNRSKKDGVWTEWKEEIEPWLLDARDSTFRTLPERQEACDMLLGTTSSASLPKFLQKLEDLEERESKLAQFRKDARQPHSKFVRGARI